MDLPKIISTLVESCNKVLDAAMYPDIILIEIRKYKQEVLLEPLIHEDCLKILQKELKDNVDFHNIEKFYKTFYGKMIVKSEFYAPSMTKKYLHANSQKFC